MKKLIIILLTLCCFTFCFIFSACKVSDAPETSVSSSIAGPATEEDTSVPQTGTDRFLEATDGTVSNETGPQDSISVSDSSKTDVKSEAEESSRAPETTDVTKPKTDSEPVTPTLPIKPAESTPPKETSSSQTEPEPENVKTPDPEPTKPDPPTESTIPPVDMEAEYARIIREATQYAESYAAKGFTFVWDDSLEFGWETGYMGTPRVKYEGVDGVIEMLKYHIDKIVKVATDPGNGLSGYSANYKVVQVTVDGDIAFVVLYG